MFLFYFLCWRMADVFFIFMLFFVLATWPTWFSPLYGRVSFLCLAKEKVPKERIPDIPALRVLCDARAERGACGTRYAQTVLAKTPLSSCAARRAQTGEVENQGQQDKRLDQRLKIKHSHLTSFRHGSSRYPSC